ncbi:MAG TPA: hypothetical protein VF845_01525, partial [Terriglobales bacterium]
QDDSVDFCRRRGLLPMAWAFADGVDFADSVDLCRQHQLMPSRVDLCHEPTEHYASVVFHK